MLCKYTEDTLDVKIKEETGSISYKPNGTLIDNISINLTKVKYWFRGFPGPEYGTNFYLENKTKSENIAQTYMNNEATGIIEKDTNDLLKVSFSNTNSYNVSVSAQVIFYIPTYKTGKKLIITELKEIGFITTLISFGRLPNGEWRDGN